MAVFEVLEKKAKQEWQEVVIQNVCPAALPCRRRLLGLAHRLGHDSGGHFPDRDILKSWQVISQRIELAVLLGTI